MTEMRIARHKTALSRSSLSRPIATAIADGLIGQESTLFDYGCGKGDDIRYLAAMGYLVEGWDPTHRSNVKPRPAEVVNLGFVLNVIEDPLERVHVLNRAWSLTEKVLVVAARMVWDARGLSGRPMGDGVLTRNGTFQKFYEQAELAQWIESASDVKPYAAAPGIFYLIRDESLAQRFLASRVYSYRPRITISSQDQYAANETILQPLLEFMNHHARPPKSHELAPDVVQALTEAIGGVGKAQRLIRRVTDDEHWEQVAQHRRAELLTYVALSRFGRRPKFGQLDNTLAGDLRATFGTYQRACLEADRLLLACGDQALLQVNARGSKIGKQTPTALYVHRSAMPEVSPVLQVYEGCARVLAGTVPSANMIKLSVVEPQISFLTYPEFDRDPHPRLQSSVTVNLRRLSVEWRDYSRSENPPLLHRKEEFLGSDDPRRPLYSRLTRAEVQAGLYRTPEKIGTTLGWLDTLKNAGLTHRGHKLVPWEPG
ncbi:DNA phosphorothioation-associated putative methyltransferase [uncultured Williamsia sp.]|uniref:DNA phosphorothioation-associated putative methyltransferase n=1 Tax=uncultured Williamsia sp. TaxID=259311 RepID=UPI00263635D6|nr:DNA phosphorothioation-associated putative methyltransferase [uncultured Williamsia sp.]